MHDKTMKFYLACVRQANKWNFGNVQGSQGYEEIGTLIYCSWECKQIQLLWKAIWQCLSTFWIFVLIDSVIPVGIYPQDILTTLCQIMCQDVYCNIITTKNTHINQQVKYIYVMGKYIVTKTWGKAIYSCGHEKIF